jgi:hypothetical protein
VIARAARSPAGVLQPMAARLCRDRRGVVMAEFVIALLPILLLFLGFTQYCFLAMARLSVRHAAALAARAAVVVIEEADADGGGAPGAPGSIYGSSSAGAVEFGGGPSSGPAAISAAQYDVSALSGGGSRDKSGAQNLQDLLGGGERSSSRIKQIRSAAFWPLLSISPDLTQDGIQVTGQLPGEAVDRHKLKQAIGESDYRRIMGSLMYAMGAVALTFPREPGGSEFAQAFDDPHAPLTVRVSYLFRCQVPVVSLVMCSSGSALMFGDALRDTFRFGSLGSVVGEVPTRPEDLPKWTDDWKQSEAVRQRSQARIDAFKGHEAEFKEVEWPFMLDTLLALPGARYMIVSGEGSLPLQGARYYRRGADQTAPQVWAPAQAGSESGSGASEPIARADTPSSLGATAATSGERAPVDESPRAAAKRKRAQVRAERAQARAERLQARTEQLRTRAAVSGRHPRLKQADAPSAVDALSADYLP